MKKQTSPVEPRSVYERINAEADRIIEERCAQTSTWWQKRRLWANQEVWRSDTEAQAFENLMAQTPREQGDPLTWEEQQERFHLRRTVIQAVLKDMREVPPPRRRRRKNRSHTIKRRSHG